MTKAQALAQVFKLLSDDTRVRILQILKKRPLCVTELTSQLGITCSATSQHLRLLRQAGLLTTVKQGPYVYNLPDKKRMSLLKKAADELLDIS
jgi:DNA-binding transcriptional ArsR family regulator